MNIFSLPRCSPEEVGIPSEAVERCLRALCHEETTMNGFMAARRGKVFSECWWAPYRADLPHSNHSFGKSYTATAVGIAVGEGLLRLDERMTDIFADEIREKGVVLPEGVDRITVEHVLTMTNGMACHPDLNGDFIAHYFSTPLAWEPGTHFTYNTAGSCMLGALILKRSGQNLKDYLTPRLFEKIGIDPDNFVWRQFRGTGVDAEPGTFSRTEDNLRLAMLYLQGGRWNGEQIVPEDFVRSALSVHVSTADAPEQKDGRCGYGYQLWACSIPGLFRFDGGQGQFGLIWPERELVIAVHEGAMGPRGPQRTLEAIYETLFPALADAPLPEDPQALAALRRAEAEAALPADPTGGAPDPSLLGDYRVTSGVFDPWLTASPPGAGDFFALFRDPTSDRPIRGFSLSLEAEDLLLSFDGGEIRAALDGRLRECYTDSPFAPLGAYAASARFGADELTMRVHWLNGWFETELRFARAGTGLLVEIKKLRLNEADNYLTYTAEALKE